MDKSPLSCRCIKKNNIFHFCFVYLLYSKLYILFSRSFPLLVFKPFLTFPLLLDAFFPLNSIKQGLLHSEFFLHFATHPFPNMYLVNYTLNDSLCISSLVGVQPVCRFGGRKYGFNGNDSLKIRFIKASPSV